MRQQAQRFSKIHNDKKTRVISAKKFWQSLQDNQKITQKQQVIASALQANSDMVAKSKNYGMHRRPTESHVNLIQDIYSQDQTIFKNIPESIDCQKCILSEQYFNLDQQQEINIQIQKNKSTDQESQSHQVLDLNLQASDLNQEKGAQNSLKVKFKQKQKLQQQNLDNKNPPPIVGTTKNKYIYQQKMYHSNVLSAGCLSHQILQKYLNRDIKNGRQESKTTHQGQQITNEQLKSKKEEVMPFQIPQKKGLGETNSGYVDDSQDVSRVQLKFNSDENTTVRKESSPNLYFLGQKTSDGGFGYSLFDYAVPPKKLKQRAHQPIVTATHQTEYVIPKSYNPTSSHDCSIGKKAPNRKVIQTGKWLKKNMDLKADGLESSSAVESKSSEEKNTNNQRNGHKNRIKLSDDNPSNDQLLGMLQNTMVPYYKNEKLIGGTGSSESKHDSESAGCQQQVLPSSAQDITLINNQSTFIRPKTQQTKIYRSTLIKEVPENIIIDNKPGFDQMNDKENYGSTDLNIVQVQSSTLQIQGNGPGNIVQPHGTISQVSSKSAINFKSRIKIPNTLVEYDAGIARTKQFETIGYFEEDRSAKKRKVFARSKSKSVSSTNQQQKKSINSSQCHKSSSQLSEQQFQDETLHKKNSNITDLISTKSKNKKNFAQNTKNQNQDILDIKNEPHLQVLGRKHGSKPIERMSSQMSQKYKGNFSVVSKTFDKLRISTRQQDGTAAEDYIQEQVIERVGNTGRQKLTQNFINNDYTQNTSCGNYDTDQIDDLFINGQALLPQVHPLRIQEATNPPNPNDQCQSLQAPLQNRKSRCSSLEELFAGPQLGANGFGPILQKQENDKTSINGSVKHDKKDHGSASRQQDHENLEESCLHILTDQHSSLKNSQNDPLNMTQVATKSHDRVTISNSLSLQPLNLKIQKVIYEKMAGQPSMINYLTGQVVNSRQGLQDDQDGGKYSLRDENRISMMKCRKSIGDQMNVQQNSFSHEGTSIDSSIKNPVNEQMIVHGSSGLKFNGKKQGSPVAYSILPNQHGTISAKKLDLNMQVEQINSIAFMNQNSKSQKYTKFKQLHLSSSKQAQLYNERLKERIPPAYFSTYLHQKLSRHPHSISTNIPLQNQDWNQALKNTHIDVEKLIGLGAEVSSTQGEEWGDAEYGNSLFVQNGSLKLQPPKIISSQNSNQRINSKILGWQNVQSTLDHHHSYSRMQKIPKFGSQDYVKRQIIKDNHDRDQIDQQKSTIDFKNSNIVANNSSLSINQRFRDFNSQSPLLMGQNTQINGSSEYLHNSAINQMRPKTQNQLRIPFNHSNSCIIKQNECSTRMILENAIQKDRKLRGGSQVTITKKADYNSNTKYDIQNRHKHQNLNLKNNLLQKMRLKQPLYAGSQQANKYGNVQDTNNLQSYVKLCQKYQAHCSTGVQDHNDSILR